jgi:hypothetical protein
VSKAGSAAATSQSGSARPCIQRISDSTSTPGSVTAACTQLCHQSQAGSESAVSAAAASSSNYPCLPQVQTSPRLCGSIFGSTGTWLKPNLSQTTLNYILTSPSPPKLAPGCCKCIHCHTNHSSICTSKPQFKPPSPSPPELAPGCQCASSPAQHLHGQT